MKDLTDKIDFILNERRKTTRVEMVKAQRVLKIEKSRDSVKELYDDFVGFLSTYLNTMETKELVKYKIVNRIKVQELLQNMASSVPEVQALLDKMHLDPVQFVARYWTTKDLKATIEDSVGMLLKGEKVVAPTLKKEETEEVK